jgi:hypothetical protein
VKDPSSAESQEALKKKKTKKRSFLCINKKPSRENPGGFLENTNLF